MSSRGTLVAVLLAAAALVIYLLMGRGDAPDQAPQVSTAAVTKANPPPRRSPRSSSTTTLSTEARVAVSGRVEVHGVGTPLAGAVVTVAPDDDDDEAEPRTVRTGPDGRFDVSGLAVGRYALSATAAGHLPAVRRGLEVAADTSVTLALAPGGHPLRGTVLDATGGAIEGALVRLTPLAGVAALRRLDGFGTLSTDDGAYTVHVAPGRYRVDVSHPDYATQSRAVAVGPGAQSQDFALVPMGVIEGVVRQAEGGAPVPGAWVTWQRERQMTLMPGQRIAMVDGSGMVRADDQGHFRLRGLSPGAIGLSARAPGAASEAPTVVPLAMAEHVTAVDVLVAAAIDLRGRVVAKSDPDRGIAGATVRLMAGDRAGPSATTDADGRFVLMGVLEGSHMVLASAEGWLPSIPGTMAEAKRDAAELELMLERAPTIRGRVEPPMLAQVSIELRPETMRMGMGPGALMMGGGAKVQTDDQGVFELGPALPGPTTVVARVADGRAGEVEVEVDPEGADEVVIRLEPRSTVSGTLRSTRGDIVAQASVSLRPVRKAGAPDLRLTVNGRDMGSDTGSTTEDGHFEIGGVAAGDYEVRVTDRYGESLVVSGGSAQGVGALAVVQGRDVEGLDLVVDAHDGVIRGVVRTADGDPVADVWVQAAALPDLMGPQSHGERDDGPSEHSEMRMIMDGGSGSGSNARPPVLTDDEGRFEIGGLRDASYDLVAEAGGGRNRASVVAKPGDDVALELAALGGIEGIVTLDGQPMKRFSVQVDGPISRVAQVRDSGGHFELGRLDAGRYRVTVSTAEGSGTAEVTVEAGETARKDISLDKLIEVSGRIVDKEGAPVVGAVILIGEGKEGQVSIEHDGEVEHHVTDADGRFEVMCAAGPRALLATAPTSPRPMVVHFFVAEPGQNVDVGELKERDIKRGMQREEQVVE